MWWTSSSGRIELNITKAQAAGAAHQGQCDSDVLALSLEAKIKRQLSAVPADDLRDELRYYGAWDEEELQDHAQNLQRLLWLACGDINEEVK